MKEYLINKIYPFILGIIVCIWLVHITREFSSFGIFGAYILGYFHLTKLHK
jgi:hypothetical protein